MTYKPYATKFIIDDVSGLYAKAKAAELQRFADSFRDTMRAIQNGTVFKGDYAPPAENTNCVEQKFSKRDVA